MKQTPPLGPSIRRREEVDGVRGRSPILERLAKFRQRYPDADPPRVLLKVDASEQNSAGFNFVAMQMDLMAKHKSLSEEAAFRIVERQYVKELEQRQVEDFDVSKQREEVLAREAQQRKEDERALKDARDRAQAARRKALEEAIGAPLVVDAHDLPRP